MKVNYKNAVLLCITICCGSVLTGQIMLSEVCSKNEEALVIDGETPDYIELYNAGSSSVNLEGYGLSDDEDNPRSWLLPNISIGAGEYLIILADDEDKLDEYAHTNFKLSDGGEVLTLTADDGSTIEELDIPSLDPDQAYALINGEWQKANTTPGQENTSGEYPTMPLPDFNVTTGVYQVGTTVTISSPVSTGIIEYYLNDLDDLEKDDDNQLQLTLSQSVIICARADAPTQKQSELVCHTYIVNANHELPILSVLASETDLYDPVDGLFEFGPNASSQFPFLGANFWSEGSTEVYFQYHDPISDEVFAGHGDLEMHGGTQARTNPQKTFKLLAKEKYGQPFFEHQFFKSKPELDSYKRLVVRNASGDYNEAHCRDGFLEDFIIGNGIDVDATAYQPVAVYINGQYYGLMGLREKVDKYYTNSNYGTTDVDMLEEEAVVIEGDSLDYIAHVNYVVDNDMATAANYAQASTYFDIPSLIDYFVVQIGFNNADWPNNNIKLWRPQESGGKWRYLLFDMDASLGRWSWSTAENDILSEKLDIPTNTNLYIALMNGLFDNADFRNDVLNRHQDLFNTAFAPSKSIAALDELVGNISGEIARHFVKWPSTTYEEWDTVNIPVIREYLQDRPAYSTAYFANHFDIPSSYQLTITSDQPAAAIELNSLDDIDDDFVGRYFEDVPIRVMAADAGATDFVHWEITTSSGTMINSDRELRMAFAEDVQLHAVYGQVSSSTDLIRSHSIVGSDLQLSIYNPTGEAVVFNVYNTIGQRLQAGTLPLGSGDSVRATIPLHTDRTELLIVNLQQGRRSATLKIIGQR